MDLEYAKIDKNKNTDAKVEYENRQKLYNEFVSYTGIDKLIQDLSDYNFCLCKKVEKPRMPSPYKTSRRRNVATSGRIPNNSDLIDLLEIENELLDLKQPKKESSLPTEKPEVLLIGLLDYGIYIDGIIDHDEKKGITKVVYSLKKIGKDEVLAKCYRIDPSMKEDKEVVSDIISILYAVKINDDTASSEIFKHKSARKAIKDLDSKFPIKKVVINKKYAKELRTVIELDVSDDFPGKFNYLYQDLEFIKPDIDKLISTYNIPSPKLLKSGTDVIIKKRNKLGIPVNTKMKFIQYDSNKRLLLTHDKYDVVRINNNYVKPLNNNKGENNKIKRNVGKESSKKYKSQKEYSFSTFNIEPTPITWDSTVRITANPATSVAATWVDNNFGRVERSED